MSLSAASVILRDQRALVMIDAERGGRIARLVIDGNDRLRGPEHARSGWAQWGSYPLVPWSNRVPGGVIEFEGTVIEVPVNFPDEMAIHGLAANTPWTIDDHDERSATLSVELSVSRYHVRAEQHFELDAGELRQRLAVSNLAEWRVPVGLGIHPWFTAAPASVPATQIWDGDGPLPTGPPRPVAAAEDLRQPTVPDPPLDRCFTGLTASAATIGDLTLSWSASPGWSIDHVVYFNGVQGWVCIEPVTMATNGFAFANEGRDDTGVVTLDPGETRSVDYTFSWP